MAVSGSRYNTTGANQGAGLLPSTILGPYGEKALQYGIGQLGTPINAQALSPKIAGQTAFQQKAAQGLADMSGLGSIQRDASGQVTDFTGGTGVASYQPYLTAGAGFNQAASNLADPSQDYKAFMSPYQQQIIDTTMADFDRQAIISEQGIGQNAYTAGAFGGARQGVAEAEYQSNSDRNRAAVLAGLYGQGYQQAQGYRQEAMNNQLGLGALQNQMAGFVPGLESQRIAGLEALGSQDQALEQSKLNAITTANQTAYQLPMQRISEYANLYGSVAGAMPGAQQAPAFQPSTVYPAIGGFANVMGAFGTATQAPQQAYSDPYRMGGANPYGGGIGGVQSNLRGGGIASLRNGSRAYRRGGRVGYGKGGIVSHVQ
mgnify:FL=1|jgi:hypothetical protein|tara:strand:- start:859 stop:1980 length:1122 start_codon:yes stop_codon:yes gene_type:complete